MTKALIWLSACCVVACTHGDCPPSTPKKVPVCEEPPPLACPTYTCGGNSPVLNTFPVNGMRSDAECNAEGVQLMPGTMMGGVGGKCDSTTLEVRNNELIGLNAKGEVACSGADLKGATFEFRSFSPDGADRKHITVHIADVVDGYQPEPYAERWMAYRLTDDAGVSLCSAGGAATARTKLGMQLIAGMTDPAPGHDLAIAITTELYDFFGIRDKGNPRWQRHDLEWMHLACVDDALGKRSLYGLHGDNVQLSRAALSMMVANYCGYTHATMRGVKVNWALLDDALPGPPGTAHGPHSPDTLEAVWDQDRAVCLNKPRLLYREAAIPLSDELNEMCSGSGCSKDALEKAIRDCEYIPKPHHQPPPKRGPLPTCDQCGSACAGLRWHSYVEPEVSGASR